MNMNTEIHVRIKTTYGTDRVYPVCATAIGLCSLTGAKTLTPDAIKDY